MKFTEFKNSGLTAFQVFNQKWIKRLTEITEGENMAEVCRQQHKEMNEFCRLSDERDLIKERLETYNQLIAELLYMDDKYRARIYELAGIED